MPDVHPTSILEGKVNLADDCIIGPNCVLTGPITIGSGTRLIGHVYLQGPLTIGENNIVYPFVTLGFAPQDLKWDPNDPGAGLTIGNANTFREHATVHRATSHETPTSVGNSNYFMASAHAGHDCQIANHCIFANGTLLGGTVRVDDRVITGGNVAVHQFCRLGRGAMLTGTVGLTHDLPPFFMLTGGNVAGSVNLVGLRRSGMSKVDIDTVRWVYRTLYRENLSLKSALEVLREKASNPLIQEYVHFIESSKRGLCPGLPRAIRGEA